MEVLHTTNLRNIVFGDWGGAGAPTEAELLEHDMAGLECRLFDNELGWRQSYSVVLEGEDGDVAGKLANGIEISTDQAVFKESESCHHMTVTPQANESSGENEEREQQGDTYRRDFMPTFEANRKRDDHDAASSTDESSSNSMARPSSTTSRNSDFDREGYVCHASLLDLIQYLETSKMGQTKSYCMQNAEVELCLPESLKNTDYEYAQPQLHDAPGGAQVPLRKSSSLSKQDMANSTHVKMEMWQITCYQEDGETPREPFYAVSGVPLNATIDNHKLRKALLATQQYTTKRPEVIPAPKRVAEALARYNLESTTSIFHSTEVVLLLDESILKNLPNTKFVFHRVKVGSGMAVGKNLSITTRRFVAMTEANSKGIKSHPVIRKMKKLKLVGEEITWNEDSSKR
jgi:hypothetical protein